MLAQGAHGPLKFSLPPSPGEAIRISTLAAAQARARSDAVTVLIDTQDTLTTGQGTGSVDILTDTQGGNVGPYLRDVIQKVRQNWYQLIPESTENRQGNLAIEFAVLKDGRLASMKMVASSGDVSLDRPAWGAITAANPFPALPPEFTDDHLALRFRFFYNPYRTDLNETPATHAVLIKKVANSNPPWYPPKALDAKVEGLVRLQGMIGTNGELKDLKLMEGDKDLGTAAMDAISKWRFHPAKKDGKDIEEQARINVVFRVSGEQVYALVVWPETCCWWK
jgi:TonB family protein